MLWTAEHVPFGVGSVFDFDLVEVEFDQSRERSDQRVQLGYVEGGAISKMKLSEMLKIGRRGLL